MFGLKKKGVQRQDVKAAVKVGGVTGWAKVLERVPNRLVPGEEVRHIANAQHAADSSPVLAVITTQRVAEIAKGGVVTDVPLKAVQTVTYSESDGLSVAAPQGSLRMTMDAASGQRLMQAIQAASAT